MWAFAAGGSFKSPGGILQLDQAFWRCEKPLEKVWLWPQTQASFSMSTRKNREAQCKATSDGHLYKEKHQVFTKQGEVVGQERKP